MALPGVPQTFAIENARDMTEKLWWEIGQFRDVPRLSPRWGFSLTALDIDPKWTVGESLLAADAVRRRLAADGVWDRNRNRTEPVDFTSIAVVAPDGSADRVLLDEVVESHFARLRTSGGAVVDMAPRELRRLPAAPSLQGILSRQARISQARSGNRVSGPILFWFASRSKRTRRTVSPSPDASATSPSAIRLSNFNGSVAR
jgi:hypothetical protein